MEGMNLKKRLFIFSGVFLLLMCACVVLGWWGLEKIHTAQEDAKTAFSIHKRFQDLMISYEHILMVVHDYIIIGEQKEKEAYRVKYDNISVEKEDLKRLIAKDKRKHGKEFQKALKQINSSLPAIEQNIAQFENMVIEIFTIDQPFGNPRVGSLMKEMDSVVKKLVSQLRYETLLLRDLFEDALIKTHKNHLLIISALMILGMISFVIGFIVSLNMIKTL